VLLENACWTLEVREGIFAYTANRDRLCKVTFVYPDEMKETFGSQLDADTVMIQGNTAHIEQGMRKTDAHLNN
jgi:hypothetical protein